MNHCRRLHLFRGLFLVFASIIPLRADVSYELSGTVLDETGSPVSGALVEILGTDLSSSTDDAGEFLIQGTVGVSSVEHGIGSQSRIAFQGRTLVLDLPDGGSDVSVSVLNSRGRTVAKCLSGDLPSGRHTIGSADIARLPGGFYLVMVRMNGREITIPRMYVGSLGFGSLVASLSADRYITATTALAKDAAGDSVRIIADNHQEKRMACTTTAGDLGTITLYRRSLGFTTANYPAVDGSTSAHPLARVIACYLMESSWSWNVHWDGTYRVFPYSGNEERSDSIAYMTDHRGTHGSYVSLIQDSAELILVARMPSEDELALAQDSGVALDIQEVALDAFVFIVHAENQVNNLALQDVVDIYSGEITNWSEAGGADTTISPYQRNANSGSQELMMSLVMKDTPMLEVPDAMVLAGMTGPFLKLPYDRAGIAYTVYFYKEYMAGSDGLVKTIGINGVVPEYETIRDREYPLFSEVYVVVRSDAEEGGGARRLRDWLVVPEGQNVVKQSGYVPIGIE